MTSSIHPLTGNRLREEIRRKLDQLDVLEEEVEKVRSLLKELLDEQEALTYVEGERW